MTPSIISSAVITSPSPNSLSQEVLKVDPQALTLLAQHAFHDASFMLRPAHQQQVADILNDPEASENDKYVALQFLRNSDIAAKGILPTCQDTEHRDHHG